ncbi:MAG: pyruvoyl-dependent arginine decarboxylase [Actinomycetota bacterium]
MTERIMGEGQVRGNAARETEQASEGLTLQVVGGVGFGPTKLAAFDAALREAGIADRNLLPMSSIIPVGARVVPSEGRGDAPGEWGDRLYVVMAQLRVDTRYEDAVAGLGWVQDTETGRGVFVEHVGHTEREVRRDILATLGSLAEGRPAVRFGAPDLRIRTTVCAGEPTCAVVAAVFEADPWRGDEVIDLREPV